VLGSLTPLVIAATCLLLASGVPRRLMFSLHKPELDAWVKGVLPAPSSLPSQASIGPYTAFDIKRLPNGGVRFIVTRDCGFVWAEHGFAYSPSATPTPIQWGEKYTPAGDGWYYFDLVWD
jgi:hypothetical protein